MWFLVVLAFLSGAAALIYEIVWARDLTLLFGVSVYAVSVVTAVVMCGLGTGSYVFGRIADRRQRPLRLYAMLEISVAAYAVLFPLLSAGAAMFYLAMIGPGTPRVLVLLLRMVAALLVIFPPMFLMGGTLPVLGRLLSRHFAGFGGGIARLYGMNTFGATLGATAAGFILLSRLGSSGASQVAVGINAIAAAAAWALDASGAGRAPAAAKGDAPVAGATQNQGSASRGGAVVLAAIFVSGFCALGYEIIWTRLVILHIGNSSWAFSTVLAAYLASLAAGSMLVAPWLDRRCDRWALFAGLQLSIGVLGWVSLLAFRAAGAWQLEGIDGSLPLVLLWQFAVAAVVIAPPALLIGASLPLAVRLYTAGPAKAGRGIGATLAANTAGAVIGSLGSGFAGIAVFGIQNTLLALALLNGLLGSWMLWRRASRRGPFRPVPRLIGIAVPGLLSIALLLHRPPLTAVPPGYEPRFYRENLLGALSVYYTPGGAMKVFDINNITEVATDPASMATFRLMAFLPVLLHPDARDALVVTFGAGIVAGSLAQLDLATVHCVEINPDAREVGRYFAEENHGVSQNPRLHLYVEDGRNFLLISGKNYDLITADATHPTGADSWVLFTREYYALCRDHLRPGGLFVQWLPLHALPSGHLQTILATAAEVFEDMTLWFSGMDGYVGHILLVGSRKAGPVDVGRLEKTLQSAPIAADLGAFDVRSPSQLLALYLTDKSHLAPLLRAAAPNTDDLAVTAFPDGLPAPDWAPQNLAALLRCAAPPAVTGLDSSRSAALSRQRQLAMSLLHAATAFALHQPDSGFAALQALDAKALPEIGLSGVHQHVARQLFDHAMAIGATALTRGDTAKALRTFGQIEMLSELTPNGAFELAKRYQALRRLPQAVRLFRVASERSPGGEVFFSLGTAYLEAGEFRPAVQAYREALRFEPDLAVAYTNMGLAFVQMQEWGKAKQAWQKALQLNPGDEATRRNLRRLEQAGKLR